MSRGDWAGGWAFSRAFFALAALEAHRRRALELRDALSGPPLSFAAGPLHLSDQPLIGALPATLLWLVGLAGPLLVLARPRRARLGLLLYLGATLALIALAGLHARVPERMAIWATLLLCLGPVDQPGLLRAAVDPFARRAVLLVMGSLYLSTGLLKSLEEPAWWDGSALAYDLVDRFHAGGPLAVWVSGQPALCAALSLYTLLFEVGFVLLVGGRRSNPPLLLAGILLHLGISSLMEVGTLTLFVLCLYPILLHPAAAEDLWGRLRRARPALAARVEGWIGDRP